MESVKTKVRYTYTVPREMWRYSTMGKVEIKFDQGTIEFDTGETYFTGQLTLSIEGET